MKLQVVGTAENVVDGSALDGVDERRAFPKPRPQHAVPEIGYGFVARAKRIVLRHRAMPETGQLGKDEPHPVTLLPAPAQFCDNTGVDRRLCINKALEVERIGHGAGLASVWPASSTSRVDRRNGTVR